MAKIKKQCDEFANSVFLTIGAASLIVGFFRILGLVMAVMAISFAVPVHLFIAFWVAKIVKLMKLYFRKLLIRQNFYHNDTGNDIYFFYSFQFIFCLFNLFNSFCKD